MKLEVYDVVVPQLIKMVEGMKGYFKKAAQHADARKYDVNNLLTARLSPDQYHLAKQVQVTCFLAEESLGRVAGKVPPQHPEEPKNFADLEARIDKCTAFLRGISKEDFAGWEERPVDIFFAPGKYLPGGIYLTQLGVPNVYFHIMTVYSILRHNGVDVGKLDYLAGVEFFDKKA